jgi:hypothetical protein
VRRRERAPTASVERLDSTRGECWYRRIAEAPQVRRTGPGRRDDRRVELDRRGCCFGASGRLLNRRPPASTAGCRLSLGRGRRRLVAWATTLLLGAQVTELCECVLDSAQIDAEERCRRCGRRFRNPAKQRSGASSCHQTRNSSGAQLKGCTTARPGECSSERVDELRCRGSSIPSVSRATGGTAP